VISVRRGGVDDAMKLREVRLEALSDTPEAYGSTYEGTATWDDEYWRDVAGRWRFFLAEEADAVVGMATGGRHDDYPGTWWLFGMYVTARLRGTRVADRLVDAVEAWAKGEGASELYLAVTEQVPRARAFYERLGYRPTGEVVSLHRDTSVGLINLVRRLD
jgi:GNAT superfamily N-acetyltransferase